MLCNVRVYCIERYNMKHHHHIHFLDADRIHVGVAYMYGILSQVV